MHEIVVVHMLKIWDVALRQNGILSFQNHSIIKSKFEKKRKNTGILYYQWKSKSIFVRSCPYFSRLLPMNFLMPKFLLYLAWRRTV